MTDRKRCRHPKEHVVEKTASTGSVKAKCKKCGAKGSRLPWGGHIRWHYPEKGKRN